MLLRLPARAGVRGGASGAQDRSVLGFDAAAAALGYRETGDPFAGVWDARPALRIGFCSSMSRGFLRDLIARVHGQPDAPALSFLEGAPHDIVRAAARGKIDIGFVYGLHDWEKLQYEELWREPLAVLMPERHPLAANGVLEPRALRGQTFLVAGDMAERELHLALLGRAIGPGQHPVVTMPVERDTVFDLVALGFGLALTTGSALGAPHAGVAARPLDASIEPIAFHAVWRASNHNQALARFLAEARGLAAEQRA
jgi:DNA-binding transcriptional LysR family regulator